MVNKRAREIDQDKKLSKRLMQSTPMRLLAFMDADGRQTPEVDHFHVIEDECLYEFYAIDITSIHLHFACTTFTSI